MSTVPAKLLLCRAALLSVVFPEGCGYQVRWAAGCRFVRRRVRCQNPHLWWKLYTLFSRFLKVYYQVPLLVPLSDHAKGSMDVSL